MRFLNSKRSIHLYFGTHNNIVSHSPRNRTEKRIPEIQTPPVHHKKRLQRLLNAIMIKLKSCCESCGESFFVAQKLWIKLKLGKLNLSKNSNKSLNNMYNRNNQRVIIQRINIVASIWAKRLTLNLTPIRFYIKYKITNIWTIFEEL